MTFKIKTFVLLLLISLVTFSANYTMNGSDVYWENANAKISCNAYATTSPYNQVCDFWYKGVSPLSLNASVVFNLNEATPTGAYLWQNISHLSYLNNSRLVSNVTKIQTSIATCQWGLNASAIHRNITTTVNSTIYCFDTWVNNSGVYNLTYYYTIDNQYYDWNDITSSFTISQFGSYKVGTIPTTWISNQTRKVKFTYVPEPDVSGKFDIYFHTGSVQEAKANPSYIKLVLDPWFNSTYYENNSQTLSNSGSWNDKRGVKIVMNMDANLTEIITHNPSGATNAYIYDTTETVLYYSGACFVSSNCSINSGLGIQLNKSISYHILVDKAGAVFDDWQTIGSTVPAMPLVGSRINWTKGVYAGTEYNDVVYEIAGMTFVNATFVSSTIPFPAINNVVIAPSYPRTLDVINVSYLYNHTTGNASTIIVGWYVNNTQVNTQIFASVPNNTQMTVNLSNAFSNKTDIVNATIYATDGLNFTNVSTTSVVVLNSIPLVSNTSIFAIPTPANKLSTLYAYARFTDNDSDVALVSFFWYVNATNVWNYSIATSNGTYVGSSLTSGNFSGNDIINCTVMANDTSWNYTTASSTNLLVIGNTPPNSTIPSMTQYDTNVTATTIVTDIDSNTIYTKGYWYVNGVNVFTYTHSGVANGTTLYFNISNLLYSIGDVVNLTIVTNDTYNVSSSSARITIINMVIPAPNFTGNITNNWSIENMQAYQTGFYADWLPYILGILCYAFSYAYTFKFSQTAIAGGVGLIAIFFMTWNPMFFAGGLLSIVVGYLIKYIAG